MEEVVKIWNDKDIKAMLLAKKLLESNSLANQLSEMVGNHIEALVDKLPPKALKIIHSCTGKALNGCLNVASLTLDADTQPANNAWHKMATIISGGIGGAGGLATLAIELPITTTLMFRSIIDIARSEGHDIRELSTRLQAMEVFALGSDRSDNDDGGETSYYAVRALLSQSLKVASKQIVKQGITHKSSPMIAKFLAKIATRFGVTVTEKAATQMIPIVGAFGGAAINALFMSHFQDIARGHFIILRLEEKYGKDNTEEKYQSLSLE